MDKENKQEKIGTYKPIEERLEWPSCDSCKSDLEKEWETEKEEEIEQEKKFIAMLCSFSGFAVGCIWIILLSGLWGGEWVENSELEVLDFLLDEKIFIVT